MDSYISNDHLAGTEHLRSRLWQIVTNQRPELDPDAHPQDAQLIDALGREMYSNQSITSRPGSYYQMNGDDPNEFKINPARSEPFKVSNPYHPVALTLSEEIEKLRAISNGSTYIAGADLSRRSISQSWHDTPPHHAAAYVIPAYGDVYCAYEMMALIHDRLSGKDPHPEKPILIDNAQDCWKYLLWDLPDDLSDYNIHKYRAEAADEWEALKNKLQEAEQNAATPIQAMSDITITPESLLLVGTKTSEKIIELQKLFQGTGIRVMRLDHFANFQDPPEDKATYSGNANDKLINAIKALRQRTENPESRRRLENNLLLHCPKTSATDLNDEEARRANLENLQVFVLSEDSGMHLESKEISRKLQQEVDQKEDTSLRNNVKNSLVLYHDQNPGPEFGPVVNSSLGENGYWQLVNKIIDKYEIRDRGVINASVLALTSFDMTDPQAEQPVHLFSGSNINMLLDKPIVEKGEIPNTSHYLVPVSQGLEIPPSAMFKDSKQGPLYPNRGNYLALPADKRISNRQFTQDQLGMEYLGQHSARTFATWALRKNMALPEGLDLPIPSHPLRVGVSNWNLRQDFSRIHLPEDNGVVEMPNINFANRSWVDEAEKLCAQSDAYLLCPRPTAGDPDRRDAELFQDLFRFFSLIVSKQLVPRDKDKPILVRRDDQSWNACLEIYDHLRHIGMANDQQRIFITPFTDTMELNDHLKRAAENKFAGEYEPPLHYKNKGLELRDCAKQDYNVAVFCSATSKNHGFNEEARQIGRHLAQQGHGMVFGAADKEMMGAARIGYYHAAREKDQHAGLLIGSSTGDILPIESENPENVIQSLDMYQHTDTIYRRMQFMMEQSTSFAIYPGGAGTIQELMLLLCAKQACLPDMKDTKGQDKPIFLYNRPIEIQGETIGFYDPLIQLIGEGRLAEYGVEICNSEQEVFDAIERHKRVHDRQEELADDAKTSGWVTRAGRVEKPASPDTASAPRR